MNGALHPDDLLPWYANRSLAGAERDAVEAHLRECGRCRAELEFLGTLREQVKRSAPAQAADEVGLRRLLREVRRERARPRRRMALAAAAGLVIVVQAGLIGWLATREQPIEPLGEGAPAGVVLQLRFDPAASEARIRALLQDHDAVVIDGPGALGVYRVRLRGLRAGDREAAAKALAEFRAARGVVAQAELQ
jgi:anti-sigma factor RsiW